MLDVSFNPLNGRLPSVPPSRLHPLPLVSLRLSAALLSGSLPSDWALFERLKELRLDG